MASNHTEHIGLSQWSLSDSVVMEDFNEDNRKIDAALSTAPRIQVGSYIGTGEFGSEHPTSLTFDFVPKLVLVRTAGINKTSTLGHFCWFPGAAGDTLDKNSPATARAYRTDGNTLRWYVYGSYASEWWQLNGADTTYYYIAIG